MRRIRCASTRGTYYPHRREMAFIVRDSVMHYIRQAISVRESDLHAK